MPEPAHFGGGAPVADAGAVRAPDGTVFKPRNATKLDSTDSVPSATMITVPSAPTTGPIPSVTPGAAEKAAIVGANTVSKWMDPGFLLGLLGCLTGVITAIVDVLPSAGTIDWRVTWPKVALAVFGALGSYIRQLKNTVTK